MAMNGFLFRRSPSNMNLSNSKIAVQFKEKQTEPVAAVAPAAAADTFVPSSAGGSSEDPVLPVGYMKRKIPISN
jgi:hypothetical protein